MPYQWGKTVDKDGKRVIVFQGDEDLDHYPICWVCPTVSDMEKAPKRNRYDHPMPQRDAMGERLINHLNKS